MIAALGFSLIVIGFAAFVIWLSFAKVEQVIPSLDRMTNAVNNWGTVEGR
jgi:uncharacterized YccA/Bax inhibitor family protein